MVMANLQARIEHLRYVTHKAIQQVTKNGKDLRVRPVRDAVIVRSRRQWGRFSIWGWPG